MALPYACPDVQQIDFQDLPPLKTNLTLDFDPGVTFESKDQTDRRIPSLEQVFQTFPSVPINIDIKDNDDRLIEHVSRLINRYNRTQHTVWGHVNSKISKKLYKQNPEVNRFFSMQRVAQLLFLYYSGLLPFVPIKETHLEIFLPQIFKKYLKVTSVASKPRLVQLVDFLLIRKSLFEHLQKRGIHVYLWVLNNEEEFEAASKLGVNAIMTDYPTRLDQYLKSGTSVDTKPEDRETIFSRTRRLLRKML
ncbi:lysophospholipase D GDPD1-like [Diaphorina citri]|uniref:Lysophospholipase D GDPD1-like n=1 Tax=Diaphorina citri TaxID=121845 RepID=A0A3Q0IMY9_DIACI|nr:lysophospholipase D GDPD1-like [Diaphorina citri]